MRPAKRILLAGDDEEQVGVLGYLLRTRLYRVLTTNCAAAAEQQMRAGARFDLLLVVLPLEGADQLLALSKVVNPHTPAVVVDHCSPAEILDRVKVLTARKPGPRPRNKTTSP